MRLGSPVALLLSMLRMLGESCNSSGTVEQQKQLLWLVKVVGQGDCCCKC